MTSRIKAERTSPKELASAGMIASFREDAWCGAIPRPFSKPHTPTTYIATSVRHCPTVIPEPYAGRVTKLSGARSRAFAAHGIKTVLGLYMPLGCVSLWSVEEAPLLASLKEVYSDMAGDRDHIAVNAKAVGGLIASHEWNRLNPGGGSPSAAFRKEEEDKAVALVPTADKIASAVFWTDYHAPFPAVAMPEEVAAAYSAVGEGIARKFAVQVIAGLKATLAECCGHAMGISGRPESIRPKMYAGLSRRMNLLSSMWFVEDPATEGLIKGLKDTAHVCYKDIDKMVKAATELKDRGSHLLDEILVE